jgi:hypothetical protein
MKNFILSTLLFASSLQIVVGDEVWTWEYNIQPGGATLTGYRGPGGEVTIPSTVGNGVPVTKLGKAGYGSFLGAASPLVTSVILPSGMVRISEMAFASCTSLTNVTIPSSVTTIEGGAFQNCTKLTKFTIPESVTTIEWGAFYNTGLTSIIIPPTVESIETGAFAGCASLGFAIMQRNPVTMGSVLMGDSVFSPHTLVLNSIALTGMAADPTFGTALGSNPAFVAALASNAAFVTALANHINSTSGNYGIATQNGFSNTIAQATSNLATKTELSNSLAQSRTDGINSVLSNPNLWTLYTTNQIKNIAIGDLVLTRTNNGQFVLNYDIEQSEDLANWTPYAGFAMPLTNLPTDKAFVRIKAKQ